MHVWVPCESQIVWNTHMIFGERDHSEGRGWGSKAVWNFSKNSSVLVPSPVSMGTDGVTETDEFLEHFQREGEIQKCLSKCVLIWFLSIQLLKKHTQSPEMTLLYQFHAQKAKPCLKFQNLQQKFLDWKCLTPPPFGCFPKNHLVWYPNPFLIMISLKTLSPWSEEPCLGQNWSFSWR